MSAHKPDKCARCGHPRSEHHYNGACYGLCGKFVEPEQDALLAELRYIVAYFRSGLMPLDLRDWLRRADAAIAKAEAHSATKRNKLNPNGTR